MMDTLLSSWLIIALAFAAANLPFVNDRVFLLLPLPGRKGETPSDVRKKSLFIRLLELLVLYGVVGIIGHFFEASAGNAFSQGWEFYAITFFLFIVFAYPGFVYRYLRKQRR